MKSDPYLIQRGNFEGREDGEGIDQILSFQYMGSSEFEWGALPKALRSLRSRIDGYTYLDIPMASEVVTVFCHEDDRSKMGGILANISRGAYHLKERSDFDLFIYPNDRFECRTDFWWDIVNDFMFWRKNPEFEVKFKELINSKETA